MLLKEDMPLRGRQNAVWQLLAAFAISAAICSATARIVGIYALGWHDPKFELSLGSAVQVGLWDIGLSLAVACAVFALVLKVRIGRGSGGPLLLAAIFGVAYPVGYVLVEQALLHLDPESPVTMAAAVGYVVLYPAIAALSIKKMPNRS